MKKLLSFFCLTAALSACNLINKPEVTQLPAPVNEDYRLSLDVETPPEAEDKTPLPDGTLGTIKYIGIPASGNKGVMLVLKKDEDHQSHTDITTPEFSQEDLRSIEFHFTVQPESKAGTVVPSFAVYATDNITFKVPTVVQSVHQVPIVIFHNTTQGWEAELVGKQRPVLPTSTTLSNLSRSWTIDETIISVSGTGVDASLGVAKLFKGCSPNAIAQYVDSKGLDLEIPSTDYDVTQFSFDDTGKFTLYFSKHDPICGDFDLQSNKLSYDFNAPSNDNPLLAVSASGEFSVVDGRGRLEVDSTAKGEGHNYQLKIIFWLLPVE